MKGKVFGKIRGIYATATTQLFTEYNFSIVQPSPEIAERFHWYKKLYAAGPVGVSMEDTEDKQGILLRGEAEQLELVTKALRERLPDMIIRKRKYEQIDYLDLEFPYLSKLALDELRSRALPTVRNHHRLRIIASEYVDLMEKQLARYPERRESIGDTLEKRFILDNFEKGKVLDIDHVKLDEVISLSKGEIMEFDSDQPSLTLKRIIHNGRSKYDGLDIPKEEGDYAITRAKEGDWTLKHTYYSKADEPKGEYYNINTPIEFYPGKIRYVDLEIDVVRWVDGRVAIRDREKLAKHVEAGRISDELAKKALSMAEELKMKLED
ncbi:MAG: DUF402 domain-containing protein [Candidatus Aenigmarchaeota archaeon]|nr:DUF402 domain-containing protein [Candidatus Aenigmarchaeota archaeon]